MMLTENWYRPYPFWHRDRRKLVLVVLAVNCTIALLLALLRPSDSEHYLLTSNTTGFSIWAISSFVSWSTKGRFYPWHLILATPLGLTIGFKIAMLAGAQDLTAVIANDPHQRWPVILVTGVISIAAVSFLVLFVRSISYRTALQDEQHRAAEARQSETSAKLALLQAQIEPHFLFNTLANVQSLIERDPATAKRMLEHLNHYLRVSLGRTRNPVATLSEELDLVQTLLAIAQIRIESRLRYSVSIADNLRAALLPPLLLQPLVENALEHGIEPSIAGGEIRIEGEQQGESLVLRVCDNGVGLIGATEDGVGLSNVRARLASLYGENGRLALYTNQPSGVIAELTVPFQTI